MTDGWKCGSVVCHDEKRSKTQLTMREELSPATFNELDKKVELTGKLFEDPSSAWMSTQSDTAAAAMHNIFKANSQYSCN